MVTRDCVWITDLSSSGIMEARLRALETNISRIFNYSVQICMSNTKITNNNFFLITSFRDLSLQHGIKKKIYDEINKGLITQQFTKKALEK